MKKIFAGALAAAFLLTTTVCVIGTENIAQAASSVWQCVNCGRQINSGGTNPPAPAAGCNGDFNKNHVWQRVK